MTTRAPDAADAEAGQRIYTPLVLRAYDLVVLGFLEPLRLALPE
jgi:hypothetical protein